MKVHLDTNKIRMISLFQKLTGAHVLDSLENDNIYFVVAKGDYGLAVGKNGSKIKNAEKVFKKPIKLFEYSPDLDTFIKNMIPETKEIIKKDDDIEVRIAGSDRAKVIGRAGYKVKVIHYFLKRLHDVENFKVK